METSAKNSINVDQAFAQVVKQVVQEHNEHHTTNTNSDVPETIITDVRGPSKTTKIANKYFRSSSNSQKQSCNCN